MPSILITGSNRGLGLEWVRQYAILGWKVHATCRHPDQAKELRQLSHENPNIVIHRMDITHPDEITAVTETLRGSSIDILINNAGVYLEKFKQSNLGQVDYSEWEETFRVNTLGSVRVIESLIDNLTRSEKRLVVATTSHMGSITEISSPDSYAYRSSKAALNAAMRGIALELETRNIGVLLLHPGWVKTRMGGPGAFISTTQSVRGMRAIIDNFKLNQTGTFYRYDGSVIPW